MTNTTTRPINRREFTDALERAELNDYELYDDYSGRGMNGDQCFGVVVGRDEVPQVYFALGYAAGHTEAEDGGGPDWTELARSARTDGMGRDVIVYFPRWSLA